MKEILTHIGEFLIGVAIAGAVIAVVYFLTMAYMWMRIQH